ncbi:putative B3 domain-containing protein Os04g0347400 [Dioscorea cayenensis subsp. rotundata]|uniref:B3 domain-containing protein Os04g0347400 n=1 Tax=Dioscorea cayennensis subsp. rotundata TaxID=55577 RepID=A0AB40CXU6_DIOCR|nr:putative B3 domain-containing protein Os04g0347400 [Dioscorea cayenensis subsp. rotundata]
MIFSTGEFWHVKVQKTEEGLFFTDGWEEMIKAHGLGEGCILFFCYEGNMVFTLKIFGHDACRINNFCINRKGFKNRKANMEFNGIGEDSNSSLCRIPSANNCDETHMKEKDSNDGSGPSGLKVRKPMNSRVYRAQLQKLREHRRGLGAEDIPMKSTMLETELEEVDRSAIQGTHCGDAKGWLTCQQANSKDAPPLSIKCATQH